VSPHFASSSQLVHPAQPVAPPTPYGLFSRGSIGRPFAPAPAGGCGNQITNEIRDQLALHQALHERVAMGALQTQQRPQAPNLAKWQF